MSFYVSSEVVLKKELLELGDNLRECRRLRNLSLSQAAKQSKVKMSMIEEIELGLYPNKKIDLQAIIKLIVFYNEKLLINSVDVEDEYNGR